VEVANKEKSLSLHKSETDHNPTVENYYLESQLR
jgi:hypothetical protein